MRERSLWTWHMSAGVVILVLLGLHMAVMHLDTAVGILNPAGGHSIDWANVAARGKSLVLTATYVALLGAALFHGLYGARSILFELNPGPGVKRVVNWSLLAGGTALFLFGSWAAWAGHAAARGMS